MALYKYLKEEKNPKNFKGFFSGLFIFTGLLLLSWVAYPIILFELTSQLKYQEIVKGVVEEGEVFAQEKEAQVLGEWEATAVDYTKASNWFPQKPQSKTEGQDYLLSIPKLRIKDALVKIGGEDLSKSLIHYGGTGLPGEYGNAVIFGHSILPQFYDPKNYKAIFSLLPKLTYGDEIFLNYDGVIYRYIVFDLRVTTPEDISVLEQKYDGSYVTLVTCVPPGTKWKRLVVKARLEKL